MKNSKQAEVYNLLSNMGITIPLKHLENTFKIEGLEYKESSSEAHFLNAMQKNKTMQEKLKIYRYARAYTAT